MPIEFSCRLNRAASADPVSATPSMVFSSGRPQISAPRARSWATSSVMLLRRPGALVATSAVPIVLSVTTNRLSPRLKVRNCSVLSSASSPSVLAQHSVHMRTELVQVEFRHLTGSPETAGPASASAEGSRRTRSGRVTAAGWGRRRVLRAVGGQRGIDGPAARWLLNGGMQVVGAAQAVTAPASECSRTRWRTARRAGRAGRHLASPQLLAIA